MTKIKICGITTAFDRDICLSLGVDILGFNICPDSKRYVREKQLDDILTLNIRKNVALVTVNISYDTCVRILDKYRPLYIQFHGSEDISLLKLIKSSYPEVKLIKKVPLKHELIKLYDPFSDYLLFDHGGSGIGGTGKKFDWKLLDSLSKEILDKSFIAGGINVDNISEVMTYHPFGIDVASGSEISPGIKDKNKIERLTRLVNAKI